MQFVKIQNEKIHQKLKKPGKNKNKKKPKKIIMDTFTIRSSLPNRLNWLSIKTKYKTQWMSLHAILVTCCTWRRGVSDF